ncbi:MAG TPA: glutamine amidotransferase, partial [Planctomycetaceae bacterium]|nr:glutamine amidotransferase [Planctomycetaceae bacterium]
AVDVSRSMNTADGAAGATRMQAVWQDLAKHSARWKALGEKVTLRQFEFDRELRPLREARGEGDGDQTALGHSLEGLLREVRQQRTLGVLLLTDGAQRAVPPVDQDPLQAARKLAEEQTPIYPIGYGTTALSSSTIDLAVQDLLVDPVVFEKKLVPLKIQLRAGGASGKKARLRVLLEDRTGKVPGQTGELKQAASVQNAKIIDEFDIRQDQLTRPINLSFMPDRAGEVKIAVEVIPVEGELLTRNNRVETIITVRQGGIRIAYFDVARSEQRALRMVNGADKIQLDFFDVRGGKFRQQTRIDPAWFQRGAYDVYIVGDVPADIFGPQLLTLLAERVRDGAGLMMLGGLQNFAAGGYAVTPLADLLPVLMLSGSAPVGGVPDVTGQLTGPQSMIPTETGLRKYVMQIAPSDGNRSRWETLAPLVGAVRLQPKSELVEVWAQTRDGTPLLCASEVGKARVAAFGGDTTYQWVLHGQAQEHQRFWRQMILWLARKDVDTDQNLWVKVEPRNFLPGANVPIEFGARTDVGTPVTDAQFQVHVTGPDDKPQPTPVRATETGGLADWPNTLAPGDYWVRLSGTKGGQSLGLDVDTRFIVDPKDLELDQPNADYELLQQLADLTGGQLLRPEDLDGFLERLTSLKRDDLTRVEVRPLWDNWWLLAIFVALLASEWALRKKWGLA